MTNKLGIKAITNEVFETKDCVVKIASVDRRNGGGNTLVGLETKDKVAPGTMAKEQMAAKNRILDSLVACNVDL
ncbi:MAG: hypothetical protein KAY32_00590, partial [Candidatus Eisenbacteria sp.]|nr:hypothetical protein [Candidatus Eisenbacteria bacterium]